MFYSGYPWQETPRASIPGEAQRPAVGSIVSHLRPGPKEVAPYVSIENHPDWEAAPTISVSSMSRSVSAVQARARQSTIWDVIEM